MPRGCSKPADLPDITAARLAKCLGPLLRKWGVTRLGYSMAGPVSKEGHQVKAPAIWGPTVTNVPYQKTLEEKLCLGGRVVLINDMSAAANDIIVRGPKRKPRFKVGNFIVITVSTGVGSKVVVDGQVQLGVDGLAGEIGHMPILRPEELIPGRRCGCGGLYCLEAGASGTANAYRAKTEADRLLPLVPASPSSALIKEIASINLLPGDDLDDREKQINKAVVRAAKRGDRLALGILRSTIKPLARAVASLESQLNIRNVYFVGGFALALGDLLLDMLHEHLLDVGIIGRCAQDLLQIGRLYRVKGHDWGLRGAALAAHRACPK
jgi:predicted NBD/HSP70 family sugar kinase